MTGKAVNRFLPHAVFATLALGCLAAGSMALSTLNPDAKPGLTAPITQAVAPGKELVPVSKLRAEGTLMNGPAVVDVGISRLVEPALMSIVFADRVTAEDFYMEARSNGESVCLSDLGPQNAEQSNRGQRYWLRSC